MKRTYALLLLLVLALMSKESIAQTSPSNTRKNDKIAADATVPVDSIANAPSYEYTYNNERRYNIIHEIDGSLFVPSHYQIKQDEPKLVSAGSILIRIEREDIFFQGLDAPNGQMRIVNKYPDKVGFIYELMDMDGNPARLKIVLDQDKYVSLLYFFSRTLGEHTFYLAQKTEDEVATEQNHFTPKNRFFVRDYRNLLDKKVYPYMIIKDIEATDIPERVSPTENLFIEFKEYTINTPQGSYTLKGAKTYARSVPNNRAIASVIELDIKGKPNRIFVYLNFKQEVEFIDVDKTRYILMP